MRVQTVALLIFPAPTAACLGIPFSEPTEQIGVTPVALQAGDVLQGGALGAGRKSSCCHPGEQHEASEHLG